MVIELLSAENIKKLKAVRIQPKGPMVQITGRNGNGKTSVLDSISYALEGTEGLTSQPVRRGEESADIFLDLGDITVRRHFSQGGENTSLTVLSKDGRRYPTPQKVLDGLLGRLGFDPLAFMRMKPRDQVDELRQLVKLEIDPDELDRLNEDDYKARRQAKSDAKGLEAQLEAIPEPVPDLPKKPIDLSKLIEKLEEAGTKNAAIAALKGQVDGWRKTAADYLAHVEKLKKEIAKTEAEAAELIRQADAKPVPTPIDTAQLGEEIKNAQATNKQIEKRNQRAQLEARRLELEALAAKLTDQMEQREQQKRAAIAAAKLPVEGLSFANGEVMYNEIPISQASSSEQLRVSVAIAMAANPKLKVLRISDGSLLDEDSLDMIARMAAAEDYQVWIERVDSSGEIGIVLEDGEIAAVNEEPDRSVKRVRVAKKPVKKAAIQ